MNDDPILSAPPCILAKAVQDTRLSDEARLLAAYAILTQQLDNN